MNPIINYIKNLLATKRVVGDDTRITGLVKANEILQKLVASNRVPGISITVLRAGEVLLQKGYGLSNREKGIPMDARKTICRVASISKNIAATALAHMVSEGLISLDASFYRYVPYFPKKKWDFTIRQLAGHTAGIRGYQGAEYGLNKPYSIKQGIDTFKDDDLLFEPGTDYHYNSFDWVLISLAMEEASGVPFEDYVQAKVLDPLKMKRTLAPALEEASLEEGATEVHDQAVFYSRNRLGFRRALPVNNYYKLAGGGYLSTSEDIAAFGQAYLDQSVLNEAELAPFLTSGEVQGEKTYYGLGWQVSEDRRGRHYYGHVGNSVGGYSNLFIYPKEQLVFALLINCTNPGVQEELNEVLDHLHEIGGS